MGLGSQRLRLRSYPDPTPGKVVLSEAERAPSGDPVVRFAYAPRSFFDEIQGVIMAEAPLTKYSAR